MTNVHALPQERIRSLQKFTTMNIPACPVCAEPYAYLDNDNFNCPSCGHVWEQLTESAELVVLDANGTKLQNGDHVVVTKTLKVKGSSHPIKPGTKVKNIRLVEGDHNIDCKIEGFGAMQLKSEFVKKA